MAIYRTPKNKNYTRITNATLQDPTISRQAKGLLVEMLSYPDEWQFYQSHLTACSVDGKDKLSSALKELEHAGYLRRFQTRNDKGQYVTVYEVYESKIRDSADATTEEKDQESNDEAEADEDADEVEITDSNLVESTLSEGGEGETALAKAKTVTPPSAKPPAGSPKLLSRHTSSTYGSSTYASMHDKREEQTPPVSQFVPPTVEEVAEYCRQRKNNINAQRFVGHYASLQWMRGNTPIKDWRPLILVWEATETKTSSKTDNDTSTFDTDDFFEAACHRTYKNSPTLNKDISCGN